ncbi:MAG: type II toxin-antitoxin system RelE/ParE family toxin [Spartobacteria bacterium]|nr:type II toxin-antitoxin system RelE/ParE family toxin [Spartobacteria bacterium]
MQIRIRSSAVKDLKRLNARERGRMNHKMSELANFPDVSNIKKLTNFEPAYRLRVGNYRILFDVINDTIYIGRVLHRQESYHQ